MASIRLSGTLEDPLEDSPQGNKIRFTHMTTTGETVEGFQSLVTFDSTGIYDFNLNYGNVFIETFDTLSQKWIEHGIVTINSDTPATSIPSLLGITEPATDEDLLVFQALVADAELARDEAVSASAGVQDARDDAVEAKDEAVQSALSADSAKESSEAARDESVSASSEAISAKDSAVLAQYASEEARDESVAIKDSLAPLNSVSEIPSITNYSVGDKVQWLGYYSAGDGGSNWGIIKEGAHTEDGGSILTIEGNFYVESNLKGKKVNVRKFGCTGIDDQDASPLLQNAWDYLQERSYVVNGSTRRGGVLYFPDGDYRCDSIIGTTNDTTANDVSMSIVGESQLNTRVLVNNQDGFLSWIKTNYGLFFNAEKITFLASYSSFNDVIGENSGVCIYLSQSDDGDRKYRHHTANEVRFGSLDGTNAEDYFYKYMDIVGGGRLKFNDVHGSGVRGADRADSWRGFVGIDITDHYGPEISKSKLWGCEFAIRFTSASDPGPEGGTFNDMNLDALKGLTVYTPSVNGEPGLTLRNVNTNCGEYGFSISNRKFVKIDGCVMYNETSGGTGTYTDIFFDNIKDSSINDVQFQFPTNTNRQAIRIIASQGSSYNIKVDGCTWLNQGTAISVGASNVSGISVTNPTFNRDDLSTVLVINGNLTAFNPISEVGSGSPEGIIQGVSGSTYQQLDGGVGSSYYIKQTSFSNTGWLAIA